MTPVPVDPRVTLDQAPHHPEYGSPLYPEPGWKWEFNSTTQRLLPTILDEPSRPCEPRFTPKWPRRLYRWHPDQGHYSLVREDDDDGEDYDLYEYDTDFARRGFFKPYQPPHRPTKPRHPKIEPEPETPPHQQFFVRLPDGTYAVTREYSRDDLYVHDAKKKRYDRVA